RSDKLKEIIISFHLYNSIDDEDIIFYKSVCQNEWNDINYSLKNISCEIFTNIEVKNGVNSPHISGSARSEGFYRVPVKNRTYRRNRSNNLICVEPIKATEKSLKKKSRSSDYRECRLVQRQLLTYYVNDEFGDLLKFNQLKLRKKKLQFAPSSIDSWGLFSLENIPAEDMIIEYVGELIRSNIADERERRTYGMAASYFFRIDDDYVVDATNCGNLARFINHSCQPNCYAKIITVDNTKKVVIYSKREIDINEEITYDYKFPIEENKVECHCGAYGCRGYLN
ncbi:hypothetical protein MXB_3287, partial [Myxobolus squamalis]